MAKTDEQFDKFFREGLEHHREQPSPAAWDKLKAQLDAAKQPKKSFWWAIAAAMPLLLGIGYLIWSQVPQADQKSSLATTEGVLTTSPSLESTPEAEAVSSEEAQNLAYLAEKNPPSLNKPAPKSSLPRENSKEIHLENVVAEAVTFPIPQTAVEEEVNSTTESKPLLNLEPTRTTAPPTLTEPTLADVEDLDGYRIRIFSDGLKKEEAPNKNLITELGKTVGQVEGLLDKLDEGFGDIQDKSERLFSSLKSRKATSTEKQ